MTAEIYLLRFQISSNFIKMVTVLGILALCITVEAQSNLLTPSIPPLADSAFVSVSSTYNVTASYPESLVTATSTAAVNVLDTSSLPTSFSNLNTSSSTFQDNSLNSFSSAAFYNTSPLALDHSASSQFFTTLKSDNGSQFVSSTIGSPSNTSLPETMVSAVSTILDSSQIQIASTSLAFMVKSTNPIKLPNDTAISSSMQNTSNVALLETTTMTTSSLGVPITSTILNSSSSSLAYILPVSVTVSTQNTTQNLIGTEPFSSLTTISTSFSQTPILETNNTVVTKTNNQQSPTRTNVASLPASHSSIPVVVTPQPYTTESILPLLPPSSSVADISTSSLLRGPSSLEASTSFDSTTSIYASNTGSSASSKTTFSVSSMNNSAAFGTESIFSQPSVVSKVISSQASDLQVSKTLSITPSTTLETLALPSSPTLGEMTTLIGRGRNTSTVSSVILSATVSSNPGMSGLLASSSSAFAVGASLNVSVTRISSTNTSSAQQPGFSSSSARANQSYADLTSRISNYSKVRTTVPQQISTPVIVSQSSILPSIQSKAVFDSQVSSTLVQETTALYRSPTPAVNSLSVENSKISSAIKDTIIISQTRHSTQSTQSIRLNESVSSASFSNITGTRSIYGVEHGSSSVVYTPKLSASQTVLSTSKVSSGPLQSAFVISTIITSQVLQPTPSAQTTAAITRTNNTASRTASFVNASSAPLVLSSGVASTQTASSLSLPRLTTATASIYRSSVLVDSTTTASPSSNIRTPALRTEAIGGSSIQSTVTTLSVPVGSSIAAGRISSQPMVVSITDQSIYPSQVTVVEPFIVFSSLYPCWITIAVNSTPSSLYANQTQNIAAATLAETQTISTEMLPQSLNRMATTVPQRYQASSTQSLFSVSQSSVNVVPSIQGISGKKRKRRAIIENSNNATYSIISSESATSSVFNLNIIASVEPFAFNTSSNFVPTATLPQSLLPNSTYIQSASIAGSQNQRATAAVGHLTTQIAASIASNMSSNFVPTATLPQHLLPNSTYIQTVSTAESQNQRTTASLGHLTTQIAASIASNMSSNFVPTATLPKHLLPNSTYIQTVSTAESQKQRTTAALGHLTTQIAASIASNMSSNFVPTATLPQRLLPNSTYVQSASIEGSQNQRTTAAAGHLTTEIAASFASNISSNFVPTATLRQSLLPNSTYIQSASTAGSQNQRTTAAVGHLTTRIAASFASNMSSNFVPTATLRQSLLPNSTYIQSASTAGSQNQRTTAAVGHLTTRIAASIASNTSSNFVPTATLPQSFLPNSTYIQSASIEGSKNQRTTAAVGHLTTQIAASIASNMSSNFVPTVTLPQHLLPNSTYIQTVSTAESQNQRTAAALGHLTTQMAASIASNMSSNFVPTSTLPQRLLPNSTFIQSASIEGSQNQRTTAAAGHLTTQIAASIASNMSSNFVPTATLPHSLLPNSTYIQSASTAGSQNQRTTAAAGHLTTQMAASIASNMSSNFVPTATLPHSLLPNSTYIQSVSIAGSQNQRTTAAAGHLTTQMAASIASNMSSNFVPTATLPHSLLPNSTYIQSVSIAGSQNQRTTAAVGHLTTQIAASFTSNMSSNFVPTTTLLPSLLPKFTSAQSASVDGSQLKHSTQTTNNVSSQTGASFEFYTPVVTSTLYTRSVSNLLSSVASASVLRSQDQRTSSIAENVGNTTIVLLNISSTIIPTAIVPHASIVSLVPSPSSSLSGSQSQQTAQTVGNSIISSLASNFTSLTFHSIFASESMQSKSTKLSVYPVSSELPSVTPALNQTALSSSLDVSSSVLQKAVSSSGISSVPGKVTVTSTLGLCVAYYTSKVFQSSIAASLSTVTPALLSRTSIATGTERTLALSASLTPSLEAISSSYVSSEPNVTSVSKPSPQVLQSLSSSEISLAMTANQSGLPFSTLQPVMSSSLVTPLITTAKEPISGILSTQTAVIPTVETVSSARMLTTSYLQASTERYSSSMKLATQTSSSYPSSSVIAPSVSISMQSGSSFTSFVANSSSVSRQVTSTSSSSRHYISNSSVIQFSMTKIHTVGQASSLSIILAASSVRVASKSSDLSSVRVVPSSAQVESKSSVLTSTPVETQSSSRHVISDVSTPVTLQSSSYPKTSSSSRKAPIESSGIASVRVSKVSSHPKSLYSTVASSAFSSAAIKSQSTQTSSALLSLPTSSVQSRPVAGSSMSAVFSASIGKTSVLVTTASITITRTLSTAVARTIVTPQPTPAIPTTIPIFRALCRLFLSVPLTVDFTTRQFKNDIESNLAKTYDRLLFPARRRKRAVTQGTTTVNVTAIKREGSSETIEVQFYVKENNTVVSASKASATLNQLTPSALSQRVKYTAMSPVTAVDATTPVTTPRPAENLLLGMVLTDDVKNNISSGNNKAVFEQKMANQYKTNNKLSSEVIFTVIYIKHEPKSIVYLEFYVNVSGVAQNATVVQSSYTNPTTRVTTATLSALLGMTVISLPYAVAIAVTSPVYQVQMTIKSVSSSTKFNSSAFKNDLELRIASLYRLAKDITARRKRRAVTSISASIVSLTTSTNNQAVVVFFVLDRGEVLVGVTLATILNRVQVNQMSSMLGVEVVKAPTAVEEAPKKASSGDNFLWVIGVAVGAFVFVLILFACLYWRWTMGGPKRKLDIEQIQMKDKTEDKGMAYGGYRDIAKYAEGRSQGGPALKTTTFTAPADPDERPDLSRSMRRKVKPRETPSQKAYVARSGRQNIAYEESEEDEDDMEDDIEDDEDDYESDVPPAKTTEPKRQVSAKKAVEVQPGPSREQRRVAEPVQKSSEAPKTEHIESEDEETESDEEIPQQQLHETSRSAAAELPPLAQMKDVQEAPSYPPVRFRTNIEPDAPATEHLPPILKHTSLTGRKLPQIDVDLKQKADLERNRNKQRQRLRASGRRPGTREADLETTNTKSRDWRKAQSDFDAILDPSLSMSRKSPRSQKRARRRHRLRRSHKVDIAIDGPKKATDENKNIKLNNYMMLNSPSHTTTVEESDDTETKKERDSNIEEARERIHTLLDDAFSFLQPHRKTNKESPRPKVVEEAMSERNEAPVYQAPTLPSRYTVPALPPPPHGRATAPPPGDRKRTFNYPVYETPPEHLNGVQPLKPMLTKEPMVVMDRNERSRYLSQRLGQPAYVRPYSSFAYPFEQSPSEQPVYITPVKQQADGFGGVIWSPYANEAVREDINSSTAPLFNTMPSPLPERYNIQSTPIASTPMKIKQPRHTSVDMSTYGYGGTPQPLIRAIKDELVRLSQSAKGKTQIEELPPSQTHPPVS